MADRIEGQGYFFSRGKFLIDGLPSVVCLAPDYHGWLPDQGQSAIITAQNFEVVCPGAGRQRRAYTIEPGESWRITKLQQGDPSAPSVWRIEPTGSR